jgi:nicotinate phosphoribosyltransferase
MAYGYWKLGFGNKEAVFSLFFRNAPFGGKFAVACGLESFIEFLNDFHFDRTDLEYLSTLTGNDGSPLFESDFIQYLGNLSFTGCMDAVPEGTIIFSDQPLVRLKGSIIECQVLETPLLNTINYQTLIATKAARVCKAAQGDPVLEFGLRRAPGADGGLSASRAAFVGGCSGTSNVLAGKKFGIPVKGTIAHSWVMAFEDELEAFEAYASVLPNNCILLVDTYSTIEGINNAVKAGKKLRESGYPLSGIRLDSGDLISLSQEGRKILDQNGFHNTKIVASSDLDEYSISDLKSKGARIDIWGVGTRLVTAFDHPALDGVFKLAAIRNRNASWEYKIKVSDLPAKTTTPGIQQIRRYQKNSMNIADVIYDIGTDLSKGCTMVEAKDPSQMHKIEEQTEFRDLLVPVIQKGKKIYTSPDLQSMQQYAANQFKQFSRDLLDKDTTKSYRTGIEASLYELKCKLFRKRKNTQLP